jgi:predicted metalloprotease
MKLLLAVVTLTLAVAGCSYSANDPDSANDTADATPSSATDSRPAPTATPSSSTATVSSRCGGSLEGCFTYNQMDEYLDAITPMVEGFFTATYPKVSEPRNLVFVPRGQAVRSACGVSDSQAYEYCAGDRSIYIGQDLLWAFYRQEGDAAPAIGLAHEWAHHLQNMLDLPAFGIQSQSVKVENQADCVAGAWAKYADEQGWLEEKDDLADAEGLLQTIGSAEGPGRDHGTSAERLKAFESAFKGGITACNSYFPNSPIA